MTTYVAFLRAINLGKNRQFGKDAIVAATLAAGFDGVATHINTGNVRIGTRMRSRAKVRDTLEAAYLADRGFAVPVSLMSPAELPAVAARSAELVAGMGEGWDGRGYVSFLREDPTPEGSAALAALSTDDELAVVEGRVAHLMVRSYGTSRLTNAAVERHVGVATARATTVVEAIIAKWC